MLQSVYDYWFDQGAEAYASGATEHDNPHKIEDDPGRYNAWFDGWMSEFLQDPNS